MEYRRIKLYKDYFQEFIDLQEEKVQEKIAWVFKRICETRVINSNFFKKISGVKGLFEIRIEYESNIYRIFSFFDKGNIIVIGHGFQKKSDKTPLKEIKRAKRIMEEYFSERE